jgi:hypothetical protein
VQAARERLDEGRDLGRDTVGDGEDVDARDPLGHDEQLRVRAVEEPEVVAVPVGVGGDDAAAGRDVDPAELVSERAGRLAEQHRMPAPERLQVGSVGERGLDADEDVARPGLGIRHLLEPQVARPVEDQRPHGTKTTLSASRRS